VTLAICLRCGKPKLGAFTRCSGCAFIPEVPVDLACSLILSDRYNSGPELDAAGAAIGQGDTVELDPALVERLAAEIARVPRRQGFDGCSTVAWSLIVIMLSLAVFVIWILFFAR
jgi:hypothetical protein